MVFQGAAKIWGCGEVKKERRGKCRRGKEGGGGGRKEVGEEERRWGRKKGGEKERKRKAQRYIQTVLSTIHYSHSRASSYEKVRSYLIIHLVS